MKNVSVSLLLCVVAAVLFAIGAIEAKPHGFDNVTFDLMLGLFALSLSFVLP